MAEIGLAGETKRGSWAVKTGLVAAALTLALRFLGVVVGPVAVVLAIVAIVLLPGPEWWADRFLIVAAALLGWLPILGWIPKLGRDVDVEGILLAIVVGFAVAHRVGMRRAGTRRTRQRIKLAEGLALAVAGAVTLWWAFPFFRVSTGGRMRLFIPGWDNPRHLNLIRLNLKLGSFVAVQPYSPAGIKYDAGEYPQGWHQMWAQWVRLWYRKPPLTAGSLVNIYSVAVIVTAGIAVLLGCVAIARLCRGHALGTLLSMSVVAQIFAVGVMSMSVYYGFPNIGIAVVALAIAPSILLRPTLSPAASFFVVSGLMMVGTYNWWPIALLALPTLAVVTLRLWKQASGVRARLLTAGAVVFTAAAMVAPVVLTLHFGVSHLLISGGIPPTPWYVVFGSSFALIAAVVVRQIVTKETLVSFTFGAPAVFGLVGVIVLIGYEIASTPEKTVNYYGEKLGAVVAAASLIGLALLLADAVSRIEPRLRESRARILLVGVAAVVASVSVFQIDGYVGPRQGTLAETGAVVAPGFLAHEQWAGLDKSLDPLATSFLASVDWTSQRIAQTGELPEEFSYIDIEGLDPRMDWTDTWFACLLGGLDTPRVNRAYALYALFGTTDPATAAGIISRLYPAGSPAPKLIVPESLVGPLEAIGPQWVLGSTLFTRQ